MTAFVSREYAALEKERLWPKVWQMAGRVEEIPEVGDFFTYEIADDLHHRGAKRGRPDPRLPQRLRPPRPPPGRHARRSEPRLREPEALRVWRSTAGPTTWRAETPSCSTPRTGRAPSTRSSPASPKCRSTPGVAGSSSTWTRTAPSLREFLEPAAGILDAFEFEKMRYKWRQWGDLRLQLEDRHGSLHGALSRHGHPHPDVGARGLLRLQRRLRPPRSQRLRPARPGVPDVPEQHGDAGGGGVRIPGSRPTRFRTRSTPP